MYRSRGGGRRGVQIVGSELDSIKMTAWSLRSQRSKKWRLTVNSFKNRLLYIYYEIIFFAYYLSSLVEFLGKLSFCKDSEHHKTKFEITQIQMTACIRILYTLSILIKLLWEPKRENLSGKQKFIIYGTQFFLCFCLKSACDADPCENDATCQAGYTQKKYRCLCLSGFTGENCESGKHHVKRYFVFKLIQSAKCQWNNQRTALDRKSLVLGFIQLLWLFYGKGSRVQKKTELSTQILAVNNHIYPACEIDTVINLDLDQFNKLSIVLQVNIKLQTKPSSLLDCIATEHKVLKEIIAYYSDKKISDRSRAALTLKAKAQTELPRYFFYGHWQRQPPRL